MPSIARILTLMALCAASSLTACKDASTSSPPAAAAAPAAPAAPGPAAPAEAPAAGDAAAPVEVGAAPSEPTTGAKVICTPDTRKGGICTREYRPVCGSFADAATRTFPNKCVACSDEKVASYVDGPCPGEPPPG
jgi:hypothetical protein